MIGASIVNGKATFDNIPWLSLDVTQVQGYYFVTNVVSAKGTHPDVGYIPRKMQVILHVSTKERPFLEVRHVAHPLPVILNNRRMEQRGFSLPMMLQRLEDEVAFAEMANECRNNAPTTTEYRDTWRALYSIVHQNGKRDASEIVFPVHDTDVRKRLLDVISAYKLMAVPIKPLITIEEKLEFIERLKTIFMDDYEFYACVRTFIIDQVGYRLFLETCELKKFQMPLRVYNRKLMANKLDTMTTSIDYLRDHQHIEHKVAEALKQCFRLHNFN